MRTGLAGRLTGGMVRACSALRHVESLDAGSAGRWENDRCDKTDP